MQPDHVSGASLIRFLFAILAVLAAAPMAHAQANWDIAGGWSGAYVCNQGLTALHVAIKRDAKGDGVTASFRFGPDKRNPGVPEGAFNMRGSFDPQNKQLYLQATSWIRQPAGYVTVDLDGLMRGSGLYISGDVLGVGCTSFDLMRDGAALVG